MLVLSVIHYLEEIIKASGMGKFSRIARKALLGILFLVGLLNLFQYIVSIFSEELFRGTNTTQFLVMGLVLTVGAILLNKVKVSNQKPVK